MAFHTRDVVNIVHVVVSLLVVALSASFTFTPPSDVLLRDVEVLDSNYGNFLKAIIFATTPVSVPPVKISLETLGTYKTITTQFEPGQLFFGFEPGFEYDKLSALSRIFTSKAVVQNLADVSFTAQTNSKQVFMASPLWIYYHNLHLLDENTCSSDQLKNSITVATIPAGIATSAILVASLGGEAQRCMFATPTNANYYRCYNDINRHKALSGLHAFGAFVILCFYYYYLFRQARDDEKTYDDHVYVAEQILLYFSVFIAGLYLLEIAQGIPALSDTSGECPHKQTGLRTLYQIFISCFSFLWISILMLLSKDFFANYLQSVLTCMGMHGNAADQLSATGEADEEI